VVSWEDSGDLLPAVGSLAAARSQVPPGDPDTELVVVVNGPGGVGREALDALWRGVRVVVNPENRGYAAAANQGAAFASGDVLLFLNPDTRAEGNPFSELARGFAARTDAVALAPRLMDFDEVDLPPPVGRPLSPPGDEDQFTFQLRRLPVLFSDARELLLLDHVLPNNPGRRTARYADADRSSDFPIEQAAAAALSVRSDAFRRLGGFREEFVPAWHEDVDLCARLSGLGKILYWPAAKFRHRGGASSERLGYARFLPVFYANALLYRRLHYAAPARAAYRVLLASGMVLRLGVLPFRRSVPRSRAEAARAYLRVLALALGSRPPSACRLPPPAPQ
jgi:N-acetylglucosaminyl-diphospho-decaprenol L-rhamnosyltransferase